MSDPRNIAATVAILFLIATIGAFSDGPTPAEKQRVETEELSLRQGEYFSLRLPEAWKLTESERGMEATGPDGVSAVVYSITSREHGFSSPSEHLRKVLGQAKIAESKILDEVTLGTQMATDGSEWTSAAIELSFIYRGNRARAWMVASVKQGFNEYDAVIHGYQTHIERFKSERPRLKRLHESVQLKQPTNWLPFTPPS